MSRAEHGRQQAKSRGQTARTAHINAERAAAEHKIEELREAVWGICPHHRARLCPCVEDDRTDDVDQVAFGKGKWS